MVDEIPAWTAVKPLPVPLVAPAVRQWQGRLFALGAANYPRRLHVYDIATDTWSTRRPMPGAGVIHPFVSHGPNRMIVAGGIDPDTGKVLNTTWAYHDDEDIWVQMQSMPAARHTNGASIACGLDSSMYVFGGLSGEKPSASTVRRELFVYDRPTDTWTERAPLPVARYGHAISHRSGKFYIIGGMELGGPAETMGHYDPRFDQWSELPALPVASDTTTAVCGSTKILVTGAGATAEEHKVTHAYELATKSWYEQATTGHDGRSEVGNAWSQNYFYLVGGVDAAGLPLSSVLRLSAPDPEETEDRAGQIWPRSGVLVNGHWETPAPPTPPAVFRMESAYLELDESGSTEGGNNSAYVRGRLHVTGVAGAGLTSMRGSFYLLNAANKYEADAQLLPLTQSAPGVWSTAWRINLIERNRYGVGGASWGPWTKHAEVIAEPVPVAWPASRPFNAATSTNDPGGLRWLIGDPIPSWITRTPDLAGHPNAGLAPVGPLSTVMPQAQPPPDLKPVWVEGNPVGQLWPRPGPDVAVGHWVTPAPVEAPPPVTPVVRIRDTFTRTGPLNNSSKSDSGHLWQVDSSTDTTDGTKAKVSGLVAAYWYWLWHADYNAASGTAQPDSNTDTVALEVEIACADPATADFLLCPVAFRSNWRGLGVGPVDASTLAVYTVAVNAATDTGIRLALSSPMVAGVSRKIAVAYTRSTGVVKLYDNGVLASTGTLAADKRPIMLLDPAVDGARIGSRVQFRTGRKSAQVYTLDSFTSYDSEPPLPPPPPPPPSDPVWVVDSKAGLVWP